MALWHRFKPLKLFLDGIEKEILGGSDTVAYYSSREELDFKLTYFLEPPKGFFGALTAKKSKVNESLSPKQFDIDIQIHGDEQTKQIKNLGGGALVGAVVAGPVGAAAGAWLSSKRKECPCVISIPSLKLELHALAPIGYIKEYEKQQFFNRSDT